MPKVVDVEVRRAELAGAVWSLAAREGVEGLTVRGVAAEAGWSTGALVHYFTGKEELLLFAFETVAARAGERMRSPRRPCAARPRAAVLAEGLPLDAERRSEVRVLVRPAGPGRVAPGAGARPAARLPGVARRGLRGA